MDEVMDCPGGVCPVPWAKDNEEEKRSAKESRETPWDTYISKHREIWEIDIDTGNDPVDHPEHYTAGAIECIEAIESQLTPEEFRGYLKGCIAKYIWRERIKGGVESLEKAQWYLHRLIQSDQSR